EAFSEDENYFLMASAVPGQIDRMRVEIQAFHPNLTTGLGTDLLLFLPMAPDILNGGIIVDDKGKVAAYSLYHPNKLWGSAISMRRLEESVDTLIQKGKVARP